MAEQDEKKIKEIEASLARELDQQITLSAPTDTRIDGTVELNPALNLVPKAGIAPQILNDTPEKNVAIKVNDPGAAESLAKSDGNDVSMEDLDSILRQEMPDLEKELNTLREAGKDLTGKELNLSEFDLTDDVVQPSGDELPAHLGAFARFKKKSKNFWDRTTTFIYDLPIKTYKYLVRFFREDAKKTVLSTLTFVKSTLQSWATTISELTQIQVLILVGLFAILGLIVFLLKSHVSIYSLSSDPYLEDFAEHTNATKFEEKPFVPLSEEGQYPEFVVLLDKIVVNIKPSASSTKNPMVAIKLYFEVTSRETAVEMKDREKEMRDLAQRVLEGFTYDQIISAAGKKAFKEGLRKEMGSILNNGLVKAVYIDDILLKP